MALKRRLIVLLKLLPQGTFVLLGREDAPLVPRRGPWLEVLALPSALHLAFDGRTGGPEEVGDLCSWQTPIHGF